MLYKRPQKVSFRIVLTAVKTALGLCLLPVEAGFRRPELARATFLDSSALRPLCTHQVQLCLPNSPGVPLVIWRDDASCTTGFLPFNASHGDALLATGMQEEALVGRGLVPVFPGHSSETLVCVLGFCDTAWTTDASGKGAWAFVVFSHHPVRGWLFHGTAAAPSVQGLFGEHSELAFVSEAPLLQPPCLGRSVSHVAVPSPSSMTVFQLGWQQQVTGIFQ